MASDRRASPEPLAYSKRDTSNVSDSANTNVRFRVINATRAQRLPGRRGRGEQAVNGEARVAAVSCGGAPASCLAIPKKLSRSRLISTMQYAICLFRCITVSAPTCLGYDWENVCQAGRASRYAGDATAIERRARFLGEAGLCFS